MQIREHDAVFPDVEARHLGHLLAGSFRALYLTANNKCRVGTDVFAHFVKPVFAQDQGGRYHQPKQ